MIQGTSPPRHHSLIAQTPTPPGVYIIRPELAFQLNGPTGSVFLVGGSIGALFLKRRTRADAERDGKAGSQPAAGS